MAITSREYDTEATQLRAALDLGTLTCMQALDLITEVRQYSRALADVLTNVVETWHAAYVVRMQGPRR